MNARKIVWRAGIIVIVLFAILYFPLRLYLTGPEPGTWHYEHLADLLGLPVDVVEQSELLYDVDCGDFSFSDVLDIVKLDSESIRIVQQTIFNQCNAGDAWMKLPVPKEIVAILHDGFSRSASHKTNPDASELFDRILQSNHEWWRFEYRYLWGDYQNVAKTPIHPYRSLLARRIYLFDSEEGLFAFNWATV